MTTWKARLPWLAATLALLLLTAACAEKPREARGRLDTPEHHVLRGQDFLSEGRWDDADRSFGLALSLNRDHGPALAGKAIVTAHRSAQPGLLGDKSEDMASEARALAKRAISKSRNDDEKREGYLAQIRVYQLSKRPEKWMDEAEDAYEDALDLDPRKVDARPHFYMARAYRDAFRMQRATDLYRRVLGMNRGLTGEANDELAVVQKILRAEPGSRHGRAVAFAEKITRSDIAALFIEELKLKSLYTRNTAKRFDTGFKAPTQGRQFQADSIQRAPEATDIKDHPLKADIDEVMSLRIAGLQPDPAHKFHPDLPITRAEFAIMVEDILVKVTAETKLRTRYFGTPSPFADVRNDLPYFNAIQTVVTRGLMEPKNKIRGIFGPTDNVGGADALLVIRLLKNELQSYVR